ncbi:hypothetical protein A2U01_0007483, partial [Trifolium medium]|nr:hypothetical protein [Trifolium medium]
DKQAVDKGMRKSTAAELQQQDSNGATGLGKKVTK